MERGVRRCQRLPDVTHPVVRHDPTVEHQSACPADFSEFLGNLRVLAAGVLPGGQCADLDLPRSSGFPDPTTFRRRTMFEIDKFPLTQSIQPVTFSGHEDAALPTLPAYWFSVSQRFARVRPGQLFHVP